MELNYTLIFLLTFVCAITYSFEIVFGLAGTIIMLFVMSYFMDAKTLVIYSTLPQIMVATIGLSRSPRTVEIRVLAEMLLFAAAGAVIGLILFYNISLFWFEMLLAIAITVFGGWLVYSSHTFVLPQPVRYTLDFFAGMSQMLFGISGPIAMTRIMGSVSGKTVIRNYAFAFFLSLNLVRIFSYIAQSVRDPQLAVLDKPMLIAMLISAPVLLIVVWHANHLHFKINEKLFKRVVSWIIFLGGVQLLLKAVFQS